MSSRSSSQVHPSSPSSPLLATKPVAKRGPKSRAAPKEVPASPVAKTERKISSKATASRAARQDKVASSRKKTNPPNLGQHGLVATPTSGGSLGRPARCSLPALGPEKPRKKFVKSNNKEVPVDFYANFIRINDNERLSMEIDQDTFLALNRFGNQFSADINFKSAARRGEGKTAGKFYITPRLDDLKLTLKDVEHLVRQQVHVIGRGVTYNFTDDKDELLTGWSMVAEQVILPDEEEDEEVAEEREQEDGEGEILEGEYNSDQE